MAFGDGRPIVGFARILWFWL